MCDARLKKKQKKNKKGKASKEEQAAAFAELKQARFCNALLLVLQVRNVLYIYI